MLRIVEAYEVARVRVESIDGQTLEEAAKIIANIRTRSETALLEYATRFGDLNASGDYIYEPKDFRRALESLDFQTRSVLESAAERIFAFASKQKLSIQPLETTIPDGRAGHVIAPIERAACYVPGGRFPLPSSLLMTAITARVAGVKTVWVASPRPSQIILASAGIANVDALLGIGGAHAIGALAYGTKHIPRCDIIVGPGNRWVTAAKKIVAGDVAIDMLAGPSELVTFCDESANPKIIAADLLAQAEHDTDAFVALIATSKQLIEEVNAELSKQLATLPTSHTAKESLSKSIAVAVRSIDEGIKLCNELAPEHLQLHLINAREVAGKLKHYGALFIGQYSAEVFGDYGLGPNHVLPTGGRARFSGGLSVMTFLRIRTWMEMNPRIDASTINEIASLARLEGLEAHARAAEIRLNC